MLIFLWIAAKSQAFYMVYITYLQSTICQYLYYKNYVKIIQIYTIYAMNFMFCIHVDKY